MDLNATAEALAGGEATPSVEVTSTPETPDLDTALDAIWDRAQAEGIEDAEPAKAEEAPAKAEPEAPKEPEPEPAPTDLPAGVKSAWKDIPAPARDAIVASQREMSAKLAEQGRQVKAIAPIKDALVDAARELPFIREMTTEQVTRELLGLAKAAQGFRTDPVKTLVALVDQHGAREGVAKALGVQEGGGGVTPDVMRYIKQLEAKVEQFAAPEYLEQQFSRVATTREMTSAVKAFAADMPDWAEVEPLMPESVQYVQRRNAVLGRDASPEDVLKAAYAYAKGEPLEQPKVAAEPAAVEAAPAVDPERARAAKSVNVKSSAGGSSRVKTEEELMNDVWKRMTS